MNVEVDAGGRRRVVRVERRDDGWLVTVEGRTMQATVSEIGSRWSLLIGPPAGALPAAAPQVSASAAAAGPAEAGRHDDDRACAEDVASGFPGHRSAEREGGSRTNKQDVESGICRTEIGDIRPLRSYEVSFSADADGGVVVFVDGVPVPLAVADARTRARRKSRDGSAAATGPQAIVAPMPGRVVKVLVEPGQTVVARQPVVIIEAMKMENELRAPRAGTIAAVRASEGTSVDAHAVLVVLE